MTLLSLWTTGVISSKLTNSRAHQRDLLFAKLKLTSHVTACQRRLLQTTGPKFVSAEFEKFASEWMFKHTRLSPNHLQINGMAEGAIKTAKKIVITAVKSKSDP